MINSSIMKSLLLLLFVSFVHSSLPRTCTMTDYAAIPPMTAAQQAICDKAESDLVSGCKCCGFMGDFAKKDCANPGDTKTMAERCGSCPDIITGPGGEVTTTPIAASTCESLTGGLFDACQVDRSDCRCVRSTGDICKECVTDSCSPDPCNGGICSKAPKYGVICSSCPTGFTGQYCLTPITPATKTPITPATRTPGTTCEALTGLSFGVCTANKDCWCVRSHGDVCDECVTDSCVSNPCNGGMCKKAPKYGVICSDCPTGFTGKYCDIKDSVKPPVTKAPGSTCESLTGLSFDTCVVNKDCWCVASSSGICTSCVTDSCSTNPCKNSGVCTKNPKVGITCDCAVGFTGSFCETAISTEAPVTMKKRISTSSAQGLFVFTIVIALAFVC